MRPRLLDLFCGAGGAGMGYHRAGFDVVGVDITQQPHYPFEFHQADAMTYPLDGFDAIHASPPCQAFSRRGRARSGHPNLIPDLRELLMATGLPLAIENVTEAPLVAPVVLCGQMFGLGVFRHRAFESNVMLMAPPHREHEGAIGDGRFFSVTGHSGGHGVKKSGARKVDGGTGAQWRVAMGIDWMTNAELVNAIPPAYTEFIGRQLLAALERAA